MRMTGSTSMEPCVATLLAQHRPLLLAFVERHAGAALLRFEAPEDLVQGINKEALRAAPRFEWCGPEAFRGWIYRIARHHLSGRRDHWFAMKRSRRGVLRLTAGSAAGHADPADTATGPATFAHRREQLLLATKAMAMLLPRDRDLVAWTAHGVPLDVQARRLGVSTGAATRARARAIERLRTACVLLARR